MRLRLPTKNIELRQSPPVYRFSRFSLVEFIVEIFVSIVCGVVAVAACGIRRARKLRTFDAIRKLNARSDNRRHIKHI